VLIWKQPPWTHSCPAPQQVPLQRAAHAPPQQPFPAAQALPHVPQFSGSDWRSAQTPPQQVWPAGQAPHWSVPPQPSLIAPHWPDWQVVCRVQQSPDAQIWPGAQVLSQLPQFSGSVCRSVHSSPQQDRTGPQQTPTPAQQDPGAQHVAPQQMVPVGQHTSPQQVRPLGQHTAPQQTSPALHPAPLCPQGAPLHWPLLLQVWPVGQVPQEPPQPSGPHCLPWHCGAH
jgi:hypothetical protein